MRDRALISPRPRSPLSAQHFGAAGLSAPRAYGAAGRRVMRSAPCGSRLSCSSPVADASSTMSARRSLRALGHAVEGAVLSLDRLASGGARLICAPHDRHAGAGLPLPARIRLTIARRGSGWSPGDRSRRRHRSSRPRRRSFRAATTLRATPISTALGPSGSSPWRMSRRAVKQAGLSAAETVSDPAIDAGRQCPHGPDRGRVPGENGAIAASQVTGKRGLIPDDANDALRASGLYHVVSIPGLHMALFAGGLFWLIRDPRRCPRAPP